MKTVYTANLHCATSSQQSAKYQDGCSVEPLSYLHALIQLHSKECGCISYNLN